MVVQMALREGECFLVRRVADRGIDKNIGGSRARGEDRRPTRRVADRGSDVVNSDPRDLKMIKRLRKRVRDLEIQQEIKRLQQRIRDLELKGEMRKAETESSTVVWDEGYDEEQHPFHYHPPRFYEPTSTSESKDEPNFDEDEGDNGEEHPFHYYPTYIFEPIYPEGVLEDKPVFDEDGDNISEEECLFLQKVLGGNLVVSNGVTVVNIDDTVQVGGHAVLMGANTMNHGGVELVGIDQQVREISTMKSKYMEDLMFSSQNLISPLNLNFQIEEISGISIIVDMVTKDSDTFSSLPKVEENQKDYNLITHDLVGIQIHIGSARLNYSESAICYKKMTHVNKRQFINAPFDPGGTSLELGKAIGESRLILASCDNNNPNSG